MFEALPERISKKEKYFAIALFHELFKSGVKAEDFSLFIFHILKRSDNFPSLLLVRVLMSNAQNLGKWSQGDASKLLKSLAKKLIRSTFC